MSSLDISRKFSDRLDEIVLVSPDVGGVGRARELAQRLGAGLSVVDKRRAGIGEVSEMTVIGEVADRTCIIVDDICDTAGTLCKAADLLLTRGAREVHAFVTHGVMSKDALEKVEMSKLTSLVITDTIAPRAEVKASPKVRILPTAPLFSQAILNIANGTSISSLFESKTLAWLYARLT